MTTAGYVYIARAGDLYKIGMTNRPDRRLFEIAFGWKLWLPERPQIIHVIRTPTPRAIEARLHEFCAAWRAGQGREWYRLPAGVVAWLCAQSDPLAAMPDMATTSETPTEAERYLPLADAAAMLGVDVQALRQYGAAGRVTILRVGARTMRVALSDVRRLMEGG